MILVAVGIILNNAQVLLCQRKATDRYGLKWEFPGGKVEHGETPEQCLYRELNEELGILTTSGKLYHRQHAEYSDSGSFDVSYYLITEFNGTIVNRVFESYAWVPLPELSSYDILKGNKEVIVKLMSHHAETGIAKH